MRFRAQRVAVNHFPKVRGVQFNLDEKLFRWRFARLRSRIDWNFLLAAAKGRFSESCAAANCE